MKLKEWARMSPTEQGNSLAEIVAASRAPRNGQMAWADARVAAYEKQYGMTTAVMRAKVRAGELEDTADIAKWLMLAPKSAHT